MMSTSSSRLSSSPSSSSSSNNVAHFYRSFVDIGVIYTGYMHLLDSRNALYWFYFHAGYIHCRTIFVTIISRNTISIINNNIDHHLSSLTSSPPRLTSSFSPLPLPILSSLSPVLVIIIKVVVVFATIKTSDISTKQYSESLKKNSNRWRKSEKKKYTILTQPECHTCVHAQIQIAQLRGTTLAAQGDVPFRPVSARWRPDVSLSTNGRSVAN